MTELRVTFRKQTRGHFLFYPSINMYLAQGMTKSNAGLGQIESKTETNQTQDRSLHDRGKFMDFGVSFFG